MNIFLFFVFMFTLSCKEGELEFSLFYLLFSFGFAGSFMYIDIKAVPKSIKCKMLIIVLFVLGVAIFTDGSVISLFLFLLLVIFWHSQVQQLMLFLREEGY